MLKFKLHKTYLIKSNISNTIYNGVTNSLCDVFYYDVNYIVEYLIKGYFNQKELKQILLNTISQRIKENYFDINYEYQNYQEYNIRISEELYDDVINFCNKLKIKENYIIGLLLDDVLTYSMEGGWFDLVNTYFHECTNVFTYNKNFEKLNMLEAQLENKLINNLDVIEKGMKLIKNQFDVINGRIDILARDKNNVLCIIELKVVPDDKDLIYQCCYYPSQFNEPTRMITICPDYSFKIENALSKIPFVEMKKVRVNNRTIEIEDVKNKFASAC